MLAVLFGRKCKKMLAQPNNAKKEPSEDEQNFKAAKECHICGKKYTNKDIRDIRDHCHITGQYRGSAHVECNLKLRISSKMFKLPVIFHNLRWYDSHFIM